VFQTLSFGRSTLGSERWRGLKQWKLSSTCPEFKYGLMVILSINISLHFHCNSLSNGTARLTKCKQLLGYWHLLLRSVYIGEGGTIFPATMTCDSDTLVLALATLGEATEIGSFLFRSCCPRWPRQLQSRDYCMLLSLMVKLTNVANVSDPLLRGIWGHSLNVVPLFNASVIKTS